MSAPILAAERLTAGYGKIDILHGVSLDVRPGEIVSIIGPNGAGKSTAFKTIVGFLTPARVAWSSRRPTSRGGVPTSSSGAGWPTCRRAASCFPR